LGRLRQTTQGSTVTQFLYDGDRLVAEYGSSSPTAPPLRRYVHGAGVDEPLVWYEGASLDDTTRRWLIADHQGSIIADTNGAGAASRYLYGSYGEPGPKAGTARASATPARSCSAMAASGFIITRRASTTQDWGGSCKLTRWDTKTISTFMPTLAMILSTQSTPPGTSGSAFVLKGGSKRRR
jgi:hypothetical protein